MGFSNQSVTLTYERAAPCGMEVLVGLRDYRTFSMVEKIKDRSLLFGLALLEVVSTLCRLKCGRDDWTEAQMSARLEKGLNLHAPILSTQPQV